MKTLYQLSEDWEYEADKLYADKDTMSEQEWRMADIQIQVYRETAGQLKELIDSVNKSTGIGLPVSLTARVGKAAPIITAEFLRGLEAGAGVCERKSNTAKSKSAPRIAAHFRECATDILIEVQRYRSTHMIDD